MTEVATEQVPVAPELPQSEEPVVTGDQPAAEQNGTATPAKTANGSANGHAKEKKVKKAPINPKENPEGWLDQVLKSNASLNKVNYLILKWIQETVEEDESKRKPLPGKPNSVEPKQFVSWLTDGVVLAQLANKLQPGSVESVHEGEAAADKANQTSNLQSFIDFKQKEGIAPEQTVSVEELQGKWKTAYQSLFKTLYYTTTQAQQKFNTATGLDAQQIADEITSMGKFPMFQRVRQSVSGMIADLLAATHSPSKASNGVQKDATAETEAENGGEASHTNGTANGEHPAEEKKPEAEAPAAVNGSN